MSLDTPSAAVTPSYDAGDFSSPGHVLTPGTLLLTLLIGYFLFRIHVVVELVILAVLFATAIERPVRALEGRITRRAAILAVDAIILAVIIVPILAFAPTASKEIDRMRVEEPAKLRTLQEDWSHSSSALLRGPGVRMIDRLIEQIEEPPAAPTSATFTAAARAFKILIAIIATVIMAFSYSVEKGRIRRRLLVQVGPGSRDRAARLWDASEAAVGGWMRSRIILGIIVGIMTLVIFGALQLPYWPLLAILAGLTEPIPIIGPWIGGIPAVLLTATRSPVLAVVVIGVILARQLFVDTVLVPRVTKEAIGLSPLTVFLAVLIGTELFGPPGALLAIPMAAVVQIVIVDYVSVRRGEYTPPDYGWKWLVNRKADPTRGA